MSPQTKRKYAVIILTVFTFIIVTGIGNFREKQLAVNLVGDRVTQAVALAAGDLDTEKIENIIAQTNAQDPYYVELRKTLIKRCQEHELENIYMIYKDEDKAQWFYIVDTRDEKDPQHHSLGETEKRASAAVEKTIRGKAVQGEYHETSNGPFVSSYQEVKNAQGKTIAVIAADYEVGAMSAFIYTTLYAQLAIMAVALVLIGFVHMMVRFQ